MAFLQYFHDEFFESWLEEDVDDDLIDHFTNYSSAQPNYNDEWLDDYDYWEPQRSVDSYQQSDAPAAPADTTVRDDDFQAHYEEEPEDFFHDQFINTDVPPVPFDDAWDWDSDLVHDEGTEHWGTDAVGPNAAQAVPYDDAWDWDHENGLEEYDWFVATPVSIISLGSQPYPVEDAWDWAQDETGEDFDPQDEYQRVDAPVFTHLQPQDVDWDWNEDATDDFADETLVQGTFSGVYIPSGFVISTPYRVFSIATPARTFVINIPYRTFTISIQASGSTPIPPIPAPQPTTVTADSTIITADTTQITADS